MNSRGFEVFRVDTFRGRRWATKAQGIALALEQNTGQRVIWRLIANARENSELSLSVPLRASENSYTL